VLEKNKKIAVVVGARPNYVKAFPLFSALKNTGHEVFLVNSGQHYSDNMSKVFFEQFGICEDIEFLKCETGSTINQMASIMTGCEDVFMRKKPNLVIVFGDVNTTLSAAITAKKISIPVVHIEAGLRSYDRTMPEELNRIMVDSIADFLFTTSNDASNNLLNEGVPSEKIYMCGNTMIDSLCNFLPEINKLNTYKSYNLTKFNYGLITMHRASNTDELGALKNVIDSFNKASEIIDLIWPIHPRTEKFIKLHNLEVSKKIKTISPLGYKEFMSLLTTAKCVMTDSGGIQEEACYLSIPCLTLRPNTERPITILSNGNTLCPPPFDGVIKFIKALENFDTNIIETPKYWDGKSSQRISNIITNIIKL
jgi:UDP-N-acetylglucosamine 2-epimerase (non-hydrolysing)